MHMYMIFNFEFSYRSHFVLKVMCSIQKKMQTKGTTNLINFTETEFSYFHGLIGISLVCLSKISQ